MPWPPGCRAPMPLVPVWNSAEQPVLLAGGEHRPEPRVVRGERLQRRVELDAPQPEGRDVRDLGDGAESLCGSTEPIPVKASG